MKKILLIGILPVILGIIAGIARAYELAFSFDFLTGLPNEKLIVTPAIIIVAAIALVVCIVFTVKRKFPIVQEKKKSILVPGVSFLACALFTALGGYVFLLNQVSRETMSWIFAGLCLLCAFAFALLGAKRLENNQKAMYSFMALVPVLWSCVALILVFRERIEDPIVADYIHIILAYISILMFTYAQSGYVYKKNKFWVLICAATLGTAFCIIELIAPPIANVLNPMYALKLDFTVIIPLFTFAVYMPISTCFMLKNQNEVE